MTSEAASSFEGASIFEGTAAYYARHRVDYPDSIYGEAIRAFELDSGEPQGALLDLGTGTGFIARRLAPYFERTTALDVSAEMIAEARAGAGEGARIDWRVLAAESLGELDGTASGGPYRVVTIGSALHWMRTAEVIELAYDRTEVGGGIFITALPGFISPDNVAVGDELAARTMAVVRAFLGETRRAGTGAFRPPPKRWEAYLRESRYDAIELGTHRFTTEFDLDGIVGLLYSTSFANRRLLGDRVEAFEDAIRETLLDLEPSGRYERQYEAEWVLAKRLA